MFPVLGIVSCLYLMLSLAVLTWVRFLVWLNIGMIIYWFYGRHHSPLRDAAEAARRTSTEAIGNFVTVAGALGLFNGLFMTVLGLMTVSGITTETSAKWHEIGVTPEQSDTIGLYVLGVGLLLFIAGPRHRARRTPAHVGAGGDSRVRSSSGRLHSLQGSSCLLVFSMAPP